MHVDHPLRVDPAGRTARTPLADHVRDLVHQVLFTNPGERVNRPDFGCGLARLLWMPNSDVLAAASQFLVHGALQRWLGDLLEVQDVRIDNTDNRLTIEVSYLILEEATRHRERFVQEGP
ncbi:MAG: uncharacterized protein QOD77_280 [Thermoplasmata archaeon]|jgi:phage baseplate assembly protein W|nr:uncharacterized protein [Thermoplasmata archaeon]